MRVMLVDDHPVTRQGVAALINQQSNLSVCGESSYTPEALDLFRKTRRNCPSWIFLCRAGLETASTW